MPLRLVPEVVVLLNDNVAPVGLLVVEVVVKREGTAAEGRGGVDREGHINAGRVSLLRCRV